ncbi:MAG: hypothetical protein WCK27_23465 [Verrucomicrobiota bacterium]
MGIGYLAPGGYETYLHCIQGRLHQHYDYDEGSFILWGKGQPLCEDFGYYGRATAADHSRLSPGCRRTACRRCCFTWPA